VAAIVLEGVTKAYATGQLAVRDVTLDIGDGELLVLLGPSGSGKSTVLRLIAGLETPTAGRILIGGRDMTDVPPQRRDLAMVFQSYALYPHKTVRENLAFGLQVRRVEAAAIDARVRATAAALGIDTLLDRRPAELSGGQRQRVALGRAIVREPQAFLLDEPLSNLDPMRRVETRAELALLHRRLAATIVYVTHDQEEAMTLGTRIAVMRGGAVEQVGAPMDLFRRPANTFVARFVGAPAMNIWRAARRLDTGAPGDVWLGIRPHDIDVVAPGEGDAGGRVAIVEPLGPTTVAHVRIDGWADQLMRLVVPAAQPIAVDEDVSVRFRRDSLHVFDARSEKRLA
jgi:multiple sugar transport system ATP-binding protein